MAETEYMVRGHGYLRGKSDIENLVVKAERGTPVLLRDIARVELGPDERRGLTELNGEGEVVSGIAMARYGQNALEVIHNIKRKIAEVSSGLPEGVSTMTQRRFSQLDVFTTVPLRGNPLAVVHDAQGLTDVQMAAMARWTNLSETTFLLPPDDPEADYRVRIFTPGGELPFAGHPTLGSCHAWLAAGGVPRVPDVVVQQCGVGRVRVRRDATPDGQRLAFAAPALRRTGPVEPTLRAQAVAALGLADAQVLRLEWIDNGPGWMGALLADAATVLRCARPRPCAASPAWPASTGRRHAVRGACLRAR
jgi:hypothetical protein